MVPTLKFYGLTRPGNRIQVSVFICHHNPLNLTWNYFGDLLTYLPRYLFYELQEF